METLDLRINTSIHEKHDFNIGDFGRLSSMILAMVFSSSLMIGRKPKEQNKAGKNEERDVTKSYRARRARLVCENVREHV